MRLQNSYNLNITDRKQGFWRENNATTWKTGKESGAGLLRPHQEITNTRSCKDETGMTGVVLDFLA